MLPSTPSWVKPTRESPEVYQYRWANFYRYSYTTKSPNMAATTDDSSHESSSFSLMDSLSSRQSSFITSREPNRTSFDLGTGMEASSTSYVIVTVVETEWRSLASGMGSSAPEVYESVAHSLWGRSSVQALAQIATNIYHWRNSSLQTGQEESSYPLSGMAMSTGSGFTKPTVYETRPYASATSSPVISSAYKWYPQAVWLLIVTPILTSWK